MKKSILAFISMIMLSTLVFSQVQRETRAVWVTTNFRLDWPPKTLNQEVQKSELRNIIDNIKRKKLNTVYFQVRSNGTTMFESSYEPYSPYLTGKTGGKPSYDPLEEAIKECKRRGLDIHAWINVMRCYAGEESSALSHPDHLMNKHRDWIVEFNENGSTSYWLDPGLPEVRDYLVNLISEIVTLYAVDGVHLDFIRYPGKDFKDDQSYAKYGDGMNREDWRRNNITLFLEQLNLRLRSIRPYVKIGVTPIGIYANINGARGMQGYSSVFQDSRTWLKLGVIDYAVPQIYWNFNDNPKFDKLALDWRLNSYGRNIVLGIAAYKDDVKSEIENMIAYSRHIGAQGISFFRYSHIKDYTFKSFEYYAYPAEMAWLDAVKPNPPFNLSYKIREYDPLTLTLKWAEPEYNNDDAVTDYYALYSLPFDTAETDHKYLYDVVKASHDSLMISFGQPRRVNYHLALKSVDKLWNESESASNMVDITIPELRRLLQNHAVFNKPALIKKDFGGSKLLLFANRDEEVEIIGQNGSYEKTLMKKEAGYGKNIFTINDNLNLYTTLKIVFERSGRQVELTL
jgi:uncharacterized lipoprotein YddW (UPF0748 family)